MKFLVFQHIECEHPGVFRDLMKADNVEWDAVHLDQGEQIDRLEDYDALIVMGGPMDVWQQQQHPWLGAELDAIAEWVSSGKPYLGFCLGHQLLAAALGGRVGPATIPEIGVLPVNLTEAGRSHWFFKNCPDQIMSLQWHSAEIVVLPTNSEVLAKSDACRVNAMAWGESAVSVQFHVELTDTTVAEWGDVPAYATALESAMGEGALFKMKQAADESMLEFNQISSLLYRNFSDHVKKGLS
ncbi:MAG: type 1 glutamine amidotransferase [bacterium]